MNDNVHAILSRLQGVKQIGSDKWSARCPAHDDEHASLSVSSGYDGRVLIHCHAGCRTMDICRAMGVSIGSLFAPGSGDNGHGKKTIVAEYDYRDADGNLLFQTVRFEPKDFRPRRPDGKGGWIWKLGSTPRVLYRLDELCAADPDSWICIVEGEKDADNLVALGLTATTCPMGAGKWHRLADDSVLHSRRVAIIPDNDAPGRKHAEAVARALHNRASDLRIVTLPDEGKDVSDWIDSLDGKDSQELRAALLELIAAAPVYEPTDEPERVAEVSLSSQTPSIPANRFRHDLYGNADRFMHLYGRDVHWCEERGKWYVWDGRIWKPDAMREVAHYAELTMRAIIREAADDPDVLKWASACNRGGTAAREMMEVIKHRTAIAVDSFDRYHWLLGVENGVVDLRSGKLLPHGRDRMISVLCPTIYDASAPCERWLRFLSEIMADDRAMIQALGRMAGYFLTGDISEQILPIFYGLGGNGKNVLLDTIMGLMGPYAAEAPDGLVTVRTNDEHPTEIADLFGKRLVVASENEEGRKLRIGLVKKLTGNKYLKGRFMRKDYFQFERTHKTVLITNNKPVITETSNAIWRRLRLIPFDVTIPRDRQDKHLTDKLIAEWPGILAWAVRGCLAWQGHRCDLALPEAIEKATADYRDESDHVADFIKERCEDWREHSAQKMRTPKERLYSVYCRWCKDVGEDVLGRTAFNKRMRGHGFEDKAIWVNRKTIKCWIDISLKGQPHE